MPLIKNCITCQKQFSVPPCRESAKYCCQSCMPKSGENNPNWKGGLAKQKCLLCGIDFETKQKTVRRGHGKYCSRLCSTKAASRINADRALAKRIPKKCAVCGKEKFVKPSHQNVEGTYCSAACRAIGYVERNKGKNNPNHKHGKSHITNYYLKERKNAEGFYQKDYPEKLFELQRGRCATCKCKIKKYHVDHIHPIALGGSNWPENIQLLCASCNHKKHAKDPIKWANENGYLL